MQRGEEGGRDRAPADAEDDSTGTRVVDGTPNGAVNGHAALHGHEPPPPATELHLFDYDGDLYGESVRVDFIERLRPIHPFGTVEALVEAIRQDCEEARRRLSG